jgi:hypothetical protein
MCDKSPFAASYEFILSMPTGFALNQIYIFKVVQHAKAWTHFNFQVSYDRGLHYGFNSIKVIFQPMAFR